MRRELAGYALGLAAAVVLAYLALRLDLADLGHPLTRGGDTLYSYVIGKTVVENGLSATNPSLGAPGEMRLVDSPLFDNQLHILGLRLLAVPWPDGWRVVNLYYLLSYPLIVLTSLIVLRQLGISWPVSLVCALLFAFQPYHLQRSTRHLFLAAYYMVPLAVMVVLWSLEGLAGRRLAVAAVVCVVLANGGVYYAYFTGFFLLMAAGALALRGQAARTVAAPLGLALVIAVVATATVVPVLRAREGAPLSRTGPTDALEYGLRPLRLFLPASGHRVPALASASAAYDATAPFEVGSSALGVVAAAGLLLLLAWPALRRTDLVRDPRHRAVLGSLTLLSAAGLLLATRGALGALLARTVLPLIRSYARMSIFLAFFALVAVAVVLERLPRRWRWLVPAVLVVGLLDQVGTSAPAMYPVIDAEFARDQAMVRRVEALLPSHAAVFQLPVMAFPQGGDILQCRDYDPARGYLHATSRRWSYGAARSRQPELWQRHVEALPVDAMVASLCAAGFDGLWLDGSGYPDGGRSLEAALTARLGGRAPLRSDDGRFLLFDLREAGEVLARTPGWAARRAALLQPVLASWGDGFHEVERGGGHAWRWCRAEGLLVLVNPSDHPRRAQLHMVLSTPTASTVRVDGRAVATTARGAACDVDLDLAPGHRALRFSCDGPRVEAPDDPRELFFTVRDVRLESSPP